MLRLRWRYVDGAHAKHLVVFDNDDKIIIRQWLEAQSGYYTGNGDTDLVGKKTSNIKHFWQIFNHEIYSENIADYLK